MAGMDRACESRTSERQMHENKDRNISTSSAFPVSGMTPVKCQKDRSTTTRIETQ